MATCVVSGVLKDPSATAIQSATVTFTVANSVFSGTVLIAPKEISTTTASDGSWSLTIERSISGYITIQYPPNTVDSARTKKFTITVPNAATADLSSLATEM